MSDEDADTLTERPSKPIEPETPTLENAVFVLIGALASLAVVLRVVGVV